MDSPQPAQPSQHVTEARTAQRAKLDVQAQMRRAVAEPGAEKAKTARGK